MSTVLAHDEAAAAEHALSIAVGAMNALRTQVDQLAKGALEDDGVRRARADHETAAEAVHAVLALLHGRTSVANALGISNA